MTPETALSIRLQDDKIWRIRELSELVRACGSAESIRKEALLRASVPLLYAHWEGYFVLSANSYLIFLTEKRIKVANLRDEFWALTIKKRYRPNQLSGDKVFTKFLLDIRNGVDETFKKGRFERINGHSNLNSDVLEACCDCIGLNMSAFMGYREFIDKDLIDKRNHIAHGSSLRFDEGSVSSFRDKVIDLMRITQTEIENVVATGGYLR